MIRKKKYLLLFMLITVILFLFSGCQLHYPTYPPGDTLSHLKITTTPPGASIFLDSSFTRHTTPYTFVDIPAGSYLLTLVLSNYVDYNAKIRVEDKQITEVNIDLIPYPLVPPLK